MCCYKIATDVIRSVTNRSHIRTAASVAGVQASLVAVIACAARISAAFIAITFSFAHATTATAPTTHLASAFAST